MKNLKYKADSLNREQMRNILGGAAAKWCTKDSQCASGYTCIGGQGSQSCHLITG